MIRSVQWSPLWGSDGALILALTSGTLHRKGNLQKKKKTKTKTQTKTKTMVSSMGLRWGFDTGTQMENTAQEPGKSAKETKTKTKTKICTTVSSMGLRWSFDTGTHLRNTAQESAKERK